MKAPRGPDKSKRKGRTDKVNPGPGRPVGTRNALPKGAVAAIKSLRHRVPAGLPEPIAEIADRAFQTVVDVMDGKVGHEVTARLNAARYLRDETCGPIAQKVEIEVGKSLADRLTRAMNRADAAQD